MLIIRPFTWFFGHILNFIFMFVNFISPTEANTLGFAIILMTIVSRTLLLPLAIKGQKSTSRMQKLMASPEMEKINKKYEGKNDNDSKRAKHLETTELQKKHGVNMLAGCLPMFIQMPIFIGLFYVMNQIYQFVDFIGGIYNQLATAIMQIPGYFTPLYNVGYSMIPNNMEINTNNVNDVARLINRFRADDWARFLEEIPATYHYQIQNILDRKDGVERFATISLVEGTSLSWPSILIPLMAVIFTFLSSYLMNKHQKALRAGRADSNPQAAMQQKIMMFGMPLFMGFITLGMPGGVGLYWVVGNIYQIFQQLAFNKFLRVDLKVDKPDKGFRARRT